MRFEDTVARFAALDDPATIRPLLEFFDAGIDDVLLFGIVHTVERFDFAVYVQELLASLAVVVGRSERWARILVLRLLNSPVTLSLVRDQIPNRGDQSSEALRSTLLSLIEWAPESTAHAEALLADLA